MLAIHASKLSKTFPGPPPVRALEEVDLAIEAGEAYGLLGPNGAGKTTLIAILTGLCLPDQGRAEVGGFDLRTRRPQVLAQVNLVRGFSGVVERFSARELLQFHARLQGVGRGRVEEVLRRTGLWERRNREVATFSSGWRQRFFLAKALLNDPRVLFLDEPTVGLDLEGLREVRTLIRDIHRQGTTLLLTTHHLEEAQALCGRIGFLAGGRLLAEGPARRLEGLLAKGGLPTLEEVLEALRQGGRGPRG